MTAAAHAAWLAAAREYEHLGTGLAQEAFLRGWDAHEADRNSPVVDNPEPKHPEPVSQVGNPVALTPGQEAAVTLFHSAAESLKRFGLEPHLFLKQDDEGGRSLHPDDGAEIIRRVIRRMPRWEPIPSDVAEILRNVSATDIVAAIQDRKASAVLRALSSQMTPTAVAQALTPASSYQLLVQMFRRFSADDIVEALGRRAPIVAGRVAYRKEQEERALAEQAKQAASAKAREAVFAAVAGVDLTDEDLAAIRRGFSAPVRAEEAADDGL